MGALRPFAFVCRPCAGAVKAGPSRRRLLTRQGRRGRATIREAPGPVHRLSTTCGQAQLTGTWAPIDGRHLGCSGSRFLFAEGRVRRPWASEPGGLRKQLCRHPEAQAPGVTPAQAGRPRERVEPRKRVDLRKRVGPGERWVTEARASPAQAGRARWDRRGVRPACSACWMGSRRRRTLRPEPPRSHDRRCSSGSGWGEAPDARTLRGAARERSSAESGVIRRRAWMAPDP